jgi:hypothetical protein
MLNIHIAEVRNLATYNIYLGSEHLGRSTTPLLTAARILRDRGVPGATKLAMWRAGKSAPDMTTTVAAASRMIVSATRNGTPCFRIDKQAGGPPACPSEVAE